MSSSGKIRVPAEEYVIYFPPTDQSDSRITLNCSITLNITAPNFNLVGRETIFARPVHPVGVKGDAHNSFTL